MVYAVFLPQVCELAFDHIVDDPYALIMMDEGRFHRVEGELFQILQCQLVGLCRYRQLLRQAGVAHQSVVRAQEDAEVVLEEDGEGVLLVAFGGPCAHVAREAHLHRNPSVQDELRQGAELHYAAILDDHVLDEPDAMADPVGTTDLDGLPDRLEAEGFTSMDRYVEVLPPDVLEGFQVLLRWVSVLVSRDVEGDDAPVGEGYGQLCDLKGVGWILVAHRTEDQAILHASLLASPVEA